MRKRTSDRLDRELTRYDINEFPLKLQKEIAETMSHPDFDPDKLAAALEKCRKERTCSRPEEGNSSERCPWYETIGRIFVLLAAAGFLWCVYIWGFCAVVLFYDELFQCNIEERVGVFVLSHPHISIVATIALYLLCLFWLMYHIVKVFRQD